MSSRISTQASATRRHLFAPQTAISVGRLWRRRGSIISVSDCSRSAQIEFDTVSGPLRRRSEAVCDQR